MTTIKTPVAKSTKKTVKKPTVTTTDNVVPLNSDISTQLETLRTDILALAKTVKDTALNKVENRRETAKTVASDQKDAAVAKYDELSTKAELQIREKPLTSMAIAVGAGLVLGAILRN